MDFLFFDFFGGCTLWPDQFYLMIENRYMFTMNHSGLDLKWSIVYLFHVVKPLLWFFPPVFIVWIYRYMYNSTIYWWTDCPISFHCLFIIHYSNGKVWLEYYDVFFFFFISYHSKKDFLIVKSVWKRYGTAIVILLLWNKGAIMWEIFTRRFLYKAIFDCSLQ